MFLQFVLLEYLSKKRIGKWKFFPQIDTAIRNNFLISFFISNSSDILMYSVVQLQSTWTIDSFWTFLNYIFGLPLIVGVFYGAFLMLRKIGRIFNEIKNTDVNKTLITQKRFSILFENFKSDSIINHYFLFILTLRSLVVALIVTTIGFSQYCVFPMILILICHGFFMAYLIRYRPHRLKYLEVQQISYEIALFIASLGALFLAMFQDSSYPNKSIGLFFGKMILAANSYLYYASLLFCFFH